MVLKFTKPLVAGLTAALIMGCAAQDEQSSQDIEQAVRDFI